MPERTFLQWPFFTDRHRELADSVRRWAGEHIPSLHDANDIDVSCQAIVRGLGDAGWLRYLLPADMGGPYPHLDVRSLCLIRETLAAQDGLAEFAFAMQGLGAGPIALFGSPALQQRYLPALAEGRALGAFAISEANAGSDVAAMQTIARRDGDGYVIDGEKTWISNAGIAHQYVVFCRLAEEERSYIALVVEAGDAGFEVSERLTPMAAHPLGTLRFTQCRVPADRVVGEPGRGLRVALGTLDVFRTTVAAAALGFARRALDEALQHVRERNVFGQPLADFQLTKARIATMATELDASALLVYRAAWTRDTGAPRITREAAMAKMYATEAAQRIIDSAVQLLGGRGVMADHPVEKLYREIRALRIYEGTTEIQQLVIADQVLKEHATGSYSNSEEKVDDGNTGQRQ